MSLSKPIHFVTAPIRLALLNPKVTAPLLIALKFFPEKLRTVLPASLQPWVDSPALTRILVAFLLLNAILKANKKLSELVANNWTTVKFVKSQELVLVTGGASGLGENMAREFSRKGVKVVIIDLHPPKAALREVFNPNLEHH
jgi:all-trans-retinol dehydrogenase (NAD+)